MTTTRMNVVFFGSTKESVIVLSKLFSSQFVNLSICCVVTQPPRPVGRHKKLTPTPVETWAKEHNIPVLSFPTKKETPWLFENEDVVIDSIQPFTPGLLVSASYGQKIPTATIHGATYGGLNVHPSLLPRWRGADPLPWAIMNGDAQTGITIITLTENFDEGKIISQKKIPILPTDTAELLYPTLFALGADLLIESLPDYLDGKNKGKPQGKSPTPYAGRLKKEDGFEPWENFSKPAEAARIDRKFRALHPWPGLWTLFNEKRLKITKLHLYEGKLLLDKVQLEGKSPILFDQFSKAYLSP